MDGPQVADVGAFVERARRVAGISTRTALGLVSGGRGRDHGSVGSTTTTCSCEQVCSRHRWDVPDGYNIAAHAFAYCCITGWVWVLNDSQEM